MSYSLIDDKLYINYLLTFLSFYWTRISRITDDLILSFISKFILQCTYVLVIIKETLIIIEIEVKSLLHLRLSVIRMRKVRQYCFMVFTTSNVYCLYIKSVKTHGPSGSSSVSV